MGHWVNVLFQTYADYKERHINIHAASISFYAIFSLFPMLAFMVYMVSSIAGAGNSTMAAAIVMNILADFVPGLEAWMQKGIFNIIKGTDISNWVNGAILLMAGKGLFAALQSVLYHLPKHEDHEEQAHIVRLTLAFATLFLFSIFLSTVVFTELVTTAKSMPVWMIHLPNFVQTTVYSAAKSGILLLVVSIVTIGMIYDILTPYHLRFKYCAMGAACFTGMMVASNKLYHYYSTHSNDIIQSTYGVFSSMVAIIIWVHFLVNAFVFFCLYAYHLDLSRDGRAK